MKRYVCMLALSIMSMQGCAQLYDSVRNYSWNDYKNFLFEQDLNYGWTYSAVEYAAQLIIEQFRLTRVTNKKICAFIREQLAQVGIQEPERISIMRGIPDYNYYSANLNSIAMSNANYYELKDILHTLSMLKADPQADAEQIAAVQAKLEIHTAIIHHEAGHLKYHDCLNILVVLAATGAAFDWIWHKVAPLIGADAYMCGRASYTDASYIKLTGLSLARSAICRLAMYAYSQLLERRADGNIAQDIKVLKGAQRFFTFIHNQIKNSWAQFGIDMDKYPYLTYVVDPYHPRAITRAQACADRITALECPQAA